MPPNLAEIIEELSELGSVDARAMFGGHGLYLGGVFFGIYYRDRLYFKVSDRTRAKYEAMGSVPFAASAERLMRNYYEVPGPVRSDHERFLRWARESAGIGSKGT